MNLKNSIVETLLYFVVLIMVSGTIGGAIFSFHGQIYGYVLFILGLTMIPLYLWRIRKNSKPTIHSKGKGESS